VYRKVQAEVAVGGRDQVLVAVELDAPEVVAALVDEAADLLEPRAPKLNTGRPPA
jgi:hypothetical protein